MNQLDLASESGHAADRRLRTELIAWLTTVDAEGQPHPTPVWFWWDGRSVTLFTEPEAPKVRHIQAQPRVAVNLNGDGEGGGVIILEGRAQPRPGHLSADRWPEFTAKYLGKMQSVFGGPEGFARQYSLAIQVTPHRIRLID